MIVSVLFHLGSSVRKECQASQHPYFRSPGFKVVIPFRRFEHSVCGREPSDEDFEGGRTSEQNLVKKIGRTKVK